MKSPLPTSLLARFAFLMAAVFALILVSGLVMTGVIGERLGIQLTLSRARANETRFVVLSTDSAPPFEPS